MESKYKDVDTKFKQIFGDGGNFLFQCLVCGKQINLKYNMRIHVSNMHLKATNNVCQYCFKVFKNNLSCSRHMKRGKCSLN